MPGKCMYICRLRRLRQTPKAEIDEVSSPSVNRPENDCLEPTTSITPRKYRRWEGHEGEHRYSATFAQEDQTRHGLLSIDAASQEACHACHQGGLRKVDYGEPCVY